MQPEKQKFWPWLRRQLLAIRGWMYENLAIKVDTISAQEACALITSFEITIKIQPTIVEFDRKPSEPATITEQEVSNVSQQTDDQRGAG